MNRPLTSELLEIGCHQNGDARCTCAIAADAADLIESQADEIDRLRALLREHAPHLLDREGEE